MHARAVAIVLSLVMVLALAACGSSGGTATASPGGFMSVGGAWVRPQVAGQTTAAYMTLTNGQLKDDLLVGVSAPDVTNDASLHETTQDSSGMTGMQHTDSIAVKAGDTVKLEPGGYHIMLMNLLKDLKEGDKVTLTLTFEQTGPVEVVAEVRAG